MASVFSLSRSVFSGSSGSKNPATESDLSAAAKTQQNLSRNVSADLASVDSVDPAAAKTQQLNRISQRQQKPNKICLRSADPAHSLISSLLFKTLLPLLRFPHLIRSTIASTFRLRFSPVSFFFFFVKYFLESDLYFFAFSFNFGFSLFWVWIACLNLFLEFFVWITFIFAVFLLKTKKLMFLLFCVHSLRGKRWVHEALYVLCFNSLD